MCRAGSRREGMYLRSEGGIIKEQRVHRVMLEGGGGGGGEEEGRTHLKLIRA